MKWKMSTGKTEENVRKCKMKKNKSMEKAKKYAKEKIMIKEKY